MALAEIYQPIQSKLQATEALFLKELASTNGLLGELTRYIARMPGKKIRPALALLSAGLIRKGRVGPAPFSDPAVRLATAVEMIHTATLLHDDVIDGACLRRGLSTLNAKWGDTLSVLSGDYLYSKAFCLLTELNHAEVLRLMSSTTRTVCEGEVAEIQHQYDLSLPRATYLKIIHWKTASLMGASAQAGALLGGASSAQAKRFGTFGLNFGLAFQIMDDTQDLLGEEAVLGKSLGTDLASGHLTLPLLTIRDAGGPEIRNHLAQWFNGNGSFGTRYHFKKVPGTDQMEKRLKFLKEQALKHQVPAYCRRVANRYLAKARAQLSIFPASRTKSSLLALTNYLLKG